ncbi:hypothetical protein Kpol_2001p6 [Vanderwaltozyma polyspora DSM 70294]|uniref:tRNA (uracil(54)-C(5))-methyltransferase n=1 Tax=Vanderwaltozyma polyspora (strain ATCC 22028 / DSM 70294 / BCRC 21397 / CBS 2163 / NBRC 10782 / NRRL Y-8283 / UCD 57-17) TaxID=436907 RepID=A7TGP2_VANPO|nr:uncharacterized protein Kpol_2001p6 [Vanderwaltozyma polyspora DSM 70294]EDO18505.1 hypothetical protein Kpol_2001p6 [Vanderwaltozyma polyspora DSM 70294]
MINLHLLHRLSSRSLPRLYNSTKIFKMSEPLIPNDSVNIVNKRAINSNSQNSIKSKKPKLKKYKAKKVDSTSPLGVLQFEIDELLNEKKLNRGDIQNDISSILNDFTKDENSISNKYHREVQNVEVLKIGANGDGLALIKNPVESEKFQIVTVPFGLPGDIVDIKVFKTHPHYVESDLLKVVKGSSMRDDSLISCKYFGKCSGCQFQFLTYEQQLNLKKNTVINAYKFFAPKLLAENLIPTVGETIGSPLKLGYRTKLTPHFDVPRKVKQLEEKPPLGFGQKGRPKWRSQTLAEGGSGSILDIEECVIGTSIINEGMCNERKRFDKEFTKYKKGATILLRENTTILDTEKPVYEQLDEGSTDIDKEDKISYVEVEDKEHDKKLAKTCVTNTRQIVKEYVDGYTFEFSAGEFFQNNNSILPAVTKYVRDNLQLPNSDTLPRYLVDCYCGSGLFSICSSKGVDKVIGVEISADSVSFAEKNAKNNGIDNCRFIVGKAEKLFESIDVPKDRTSVILDPPRKGCDELFLTQLSSYFPAKIVYISCNVHSQARDVEFFLKNTENGSHYKIESLRGFDFFPQTHHVESVCVLSRI